MKNLSRKITLIWLFVQATLQEEWQYRFKNIIWVINGSITPLLLMSIWLVVSSVSKLALTQGQIVTYYLLSILIGRVIQVWSLEHVGRDIRTGDFSFKLLKPYYYLYEDIGDALGRKIIRLMTLIPVFVVLFWLLQNYIALSLNPLNLSLFFLALVLGFSINFFLENLLATLVFFLEEYHSLQFLNYTVSDIFSGRLIPLALLPVGFKPILRATPFRYIISFPIEIIQNQISQTEIFQGFIAGIIFLALFIFLHYFLLQRGLKKYSAFGS